MVAVFVLLLLLSFRLSLLLQLAVLLIPLLSAMLFPMLLLLLPVLLLPMVFSLLLSEELIRLVVELKYLLEIADLVAAYELPWYAKHTVRIINECNVAPLSDDRGTTDVNLSTLNYSRHVIFLFSFALFSSQSTLRKSTRLG